MLNKKRLHIIIVTNLIIVQSLFITIYLTNQIGQHRQIQIKRKNTELTLKNSA